MRAPSARDSAAGWQPLADGVSSPVAGRHGRHARRRDRRVARCPACCSAYRPASNSAGTGTRGRGVGSQMALRSLRSKWVHACHPATRLTNR